MNKLFYSFINNKSFTIYGDGNSTRDYVYVKDIASAILSCILTESKDLVNTYHLSSNVETSLNELSQLPGFCSSIKCGGAITKVDPPSS